MNDNPLRKLFRQPAMYLRLPSQGKLYPQGALDMPESGQIPVYPMTALDEIMNRTPDALFNGVAVASLMESCVPNIKDPWSVPSVDIDTILTAIKVASYGKDLDVTVTCPSCSEVSDYTIDMLAQLQQIGSADYSKPVQLGSVKIFFRPLRYKEINDNNISQFNEQRLVSTLQDDTITEEERSKRIGEAVKRITLTTMDALTQSVEAVKTDDAVVTDKAHIKEFLVNLSVEQFNVIKDAAIKMREAAEMKPLKFTCGACQHKFEQPFVLDMSNFFGRSS